MYLFDSRHYPILDVCGDPGRHALHCLKFCVINGQGWVMATDGRIAVAMMCDVEGENIDGLVEAWRIRMWVRVWKREHIGGRMRVSFADGRVTVEDTSFEANEGKWPDFVDLFCVAAEKPVAATCCVYDQTVSRALRCLCVDGEYSAMVDIPPGEDALRMVSPSGAVALVMPATPYPNPSYADTVALLKPR